MAIVKKPLTKKATGAKKPSAKKSLTKKSSPKTHAPMKSFKVSRDALPFFAVRVTRQTIYWSVLLIFIMITQLWILNIQLDIIKITDGITAQLQ